MPVGSRSKQEEEVIGQLSLGKKVFSLQSQCSVRKEESIQFAVAVCREERRKVFSLQSQFSVLRKKLKESDQIAVISIQFINRVAILNK